MSLIQKPLFCIAFCTLVLLPTLTYPLNNDQALYGYMGERLLHGGLPYVASWDQNLPLIVFIHAFETLIFGHSDLGFRLFDLLLQIAFLWTLSRWLARHVGALAATIAPIMIAAYYLHQGFWMAGERDVYVTMLLLYSLLAIDRERPILAGALQGLSLLFRPTDLFILPILLLFIYRKQIRAALLCSLGVALPIVAVILLYVFTRHLGELYDATIRYNLTVYTSEGAVNPFFAPIRAYWFSIPFFAFGFYYLFTTNRERALLTLGFLIVAFVGVAFFTRHAVYHYHPLMALYLVIVAAAFELKALRVPSVLIPLVAIVFLYVAIRGNTVKRELLTVVQGRAHSLEQLQYMYDDDTFSGLPAQRALATYFSTHSSPDDLVQIFGQAPYPLFVSERASASRFQTIHPMVLLGRGDTLQPLQRTWQSEFSRTIFQKRPLYFVISDAALTYRPHIDSSGHRLLATQFQELGNWLRTNYRFETRIGDFYLLRRGQ